MQPRGVHMRHPEECRGHACECAPEARKIGNNVDASEKKRNKWNKCNGKVMYQLVTQFKVCHNTYCR